MKTLSTFNPLLEEGFQSLTMPSLTCFATVAEAQLGVPSSECDVCYVAEKEAFYKYCTGCTFAADSDLVLVTGNGGSTRWGMMQKVSRTQGDIGWIVRSGMTLSKLSATSIRVTVAATICQYAIKSVRYDLPIGTYDKTITGVAGIKYCYFDEAGAIQFEDTTDFTSRCYVAAVFWTGTVIGGLQTELHGIRDTVWHNWAHRYLGTQYTSGLQITTNTQPDSSTDPGADDTVQFLWLTPGVIHDEDAEIDIDTSGQWTVVLGTDLTSATAAQLPFFYYNGTNVVGAAANANREPFLFTGANGLPQRESAGVLTAATPGEYVVYHYFASPFIDGFPIFARPHNNTTRFTSLTAAQSARPASLVWSAIGEWKHIYTVIFRCGSWGNTPTHNCKIVSVQDFRSVSSGPASGTNASAHAALSGLADPGAHPATSITVTATGGELNSAIETNVDLALQRLANFDHLVDWAVGSAYRVGNMVRIATEGFLGMWRCVTLHTASASILTDLNLGYWEVMANSEGPRDFIRQVAHGFVFGDVVYSNGVSTYAKAKADVALTAEVIGIVAGVTTDYFILCKPGSSLTKAAWGLTANSVYFLSDATAGLATLTEPTTIGNISLPVLKTTSTTTGVVQGMRGTVVGGANASTIIPLASATTATIQDVSTMTAGELVGFVAIDSATDYKFMVKAQWCQNAAGTNWNLAWQFVGDTPPATFNLTITAAGLIQYTMPTLTTPVPANTYIKYSLNAPAVGATFPLSISAANVLGATDGAAVGAGKIGEIQTVTWTGQTITTALTTQATLANLTVGHYILQYNADVALGTSTRIQYGIIGGTATITTYSGGGGDYVRKVETTGAIGNVSYYVDCTVAGSILVQAVADTANTSASHRGRVTFIRVG